eukprot:TRINITY_DN142_c0_g1_i3.p1 TRINITY_DN142_c0_g1~~TRINITY_DN142_c0_g1_i3.p1  ORF type:complete len:109 (-),score=40.53 TRINITY_DN142_c0_g1_i3:661-987(-)
MGSIGDDDNGRLLVEIMDKYKVKTEYYVNKQEPTGSCVVLLKDNKRCLLPLLGAATGFPTEHIKAHWNIVEEAKLLYSTAYFVSTNYEALQLVINHAFETKKVLWVSI